MDTNLNSSNYGMPSMEVARNTHNIASKIYNRQIEAIMFHESLIDLFNLLKLDGFVEWQEEVLEDEMDLMHKFKKQYAKHLKGTVDKPKFNESTDSALPKEWQGKQNVTIDAKNMSMGIRYGLNKYIEWEKETMSIYKDAMSQIEKDGEFDELASFLKMLCKSSKKEVMFVEELINELEETHYEPNAIKKLQKDYFENYEDYEVSGNRNGYAYNMHPYYPAMNRRRDEMAMNNGRDRSYNRKLIYYRY